MIGRRGFFKAIGAGVLGMALALKVPEKDAILAAFSDGLTSPVTLRVGDVFSIEGVYALNPITGVNSGRLQTFVTTVKVDRGELFDADAIWPQMQTEGIYANVSDLPEPNAAVGVMLYPGKMEWHRTDESALNFLNNA